MSVAGKGGRPLGLSKTGGRRKGTPNRSSLALAEKLAELGCDPVAILAEICMDKAAPVDARIRSASELLTYTYPKRKPLDQPQPPVSLEVRTILEHQPVGGNGRVG
jgi:hypothetical protein